MRFHWGHYCILTGVVLFFIEVYIAFNTAIDWSFTPIKVDDQPLYLAHNYVEMVGLFLFGIGISKSVRKHTKFVQALMWLTLALYSLFMAVELSTSILFTFAGVLLLTFPLLLGFYLYKLYYWRFPKR